MKNLLLTIAENYNLSQISLFFSSLRKVNSDCHVVLFYKKIDKKAIRELYEKYAIECIPYYQNRIDGLQYAYLNASLDPIKEKVLSPNSLRYFFYHTYLQNHKGEYETVIHSDVRDVFFQRNPFESINSNALYCFLENDKETIGLNHYTQLWIRHAYGDEILNKLGPNTISCSGFTGGAFQLMQNYFSLMVRELIKFENLGGLDQGIHNYLIYVYKITGLRIVKDDSEILSTISSHKPINEIRLSKYNEVLNKDGNPVSVVHQYDRHWGLLWKYNKRAFLNKKIDYFKQFLLAIKKSKKIKASYIKNLKSVFTDPMTKKYDWH